MLNLLPTECWDYGLIDTIRGLVAVQSSRRSGSDRSIDIPGVGRCLPIRSARAGIVLALKALALPPGASVAVPLYCCPVVFSAIKTAGCRPYFIEVEPETYCMSAVDLAAKSSYVDAVIAVHMFGNVCDVPALQRAVPGKPIIEDCAQSLGSTLGDRMTGLFGDIAVFSFRSGKYISAGEGGAVYCSQREIAARVETLIGELPTPSRVEECVHVLKTYFRSLLRNKPLWGLIGNRLWSAYGKRVRVTSQAPIVLTQIYETDRRTAIRRLSAMSSFISRQRSNADYYLRNSSVKDDMLCPEKSGTFFNRLQYPLLLPNPEECDQLAACLLKDKISTARPYKDIASIAVELYGYSGDCPQAERIAKSVLVIPCNYLLKPAEVQRISASVNRAWANIRGRGEGFSVQSPAAIDAVPPENRNRGTIPEPHQL